MTVLISLIVMSVVRIMIGTMVIMLPKENVEKKWLSRLSFD